MEQRLSNESVKSTLDAGHKSLTWEPAQPSGFLAGIDFDMILASPNARQVIQAMPVQPMYYALKQRGLADCLDVLPHLTEEQVTRMLDYDVWSQDRLVPAKAFAFLQHFAEIGLQELYRRFAYLDEEYQLSLLEGLLRVYEEDDYERLPAAEQDQLYKMPCGKVYYRILSDDKDELQFVQNLLESLKECNLRYAYSILGHAAFQVPNENEVLIRRFRNARLEEDGFVAYEESLQIFTPINRAALRQKWASIRAVGRQGAVAQVRDEDPDFLGRVLKKALMDGWDIDEQYTIHQRLLYLSNALCSAAQVEPDDMYGLNRVLEQCKAIVGLGLEDLAQSDLDAGLQIIRDEHPKNLFRVGLSLIEDLRRNVIHQAKRVRLVGAEELERQHQARRWGAMVWTCDRQLREQLGFEACETLKGLFNRFPMAPLDENLDSGRMRFRPIGSKEVFQRLQVEIWGILGLMELGLHAQIPWQQVDFEQGLNTALMRALLDQDFVVAPLAAEQLQVWESGALSDFRERLQDLRGHLVERLVSQVELWAEDANMREEGALRATLAKFDQIATNLLQLKAEGQPVNHLILRA